MKFPIYIAKRYLFSKSSNNAINIISLIAALGVIVGSAALFIVLSGFAGLKDFTLQFSSFVDPDLKVMPSEGKTMLVSNDQLEKIASIDGVASFSTVIEERVVLNFENKSEILTMKGVDDNFPQATIDSILYRGNWFDSGANQIVAGWGVANKLGFGLFQFDKAIQVYVPKPGKGQITSIKGAYNSINVVNTAVFQVNEELDYSFVFTGLDTARLLLNYSDEQMSALELQLDGDAQEDNIISQINAILGDSIIVKNRFQLNDALYKMLNAEHLAVYLIFTLVLIIALFNVIGSIIIMILDKKRNLSTLFSLGITVKEIRKIFFYQGTLMTLLGGAIGLFIGFILVLLQKLFGWVPITPSLPYPVTIKPVNFLIVLLTISVLGLLASKLASARISRQLLASH